MFRIVLQVGSTSRFYVTGMNKRGLPLLSPELEDAEECSEYDTQLRYDAIRSAYGIDGRSFIVENAS